MKNLIYFTVLLAAVSCSQPVAKKEIAGWETHATDEYSIQYPKEWEFSTSEVAGYKPQFYIKSKQESEDDAFVENINLLKQDLPNSDIDLKKYAEISESQIKTMITNSSILESKLYNENGNEFYKMVYTGDQDPYHFKFEQYYFIKDKKAYVLTFTTEADKFDKFKDTGEQIINSFYVK